jgi:hypothetical protein
MGRAKSNRPRPSNAGFTARFAFRFLATADSGDGDLVSIAAQLISSGRRYGVKIVLKYEDLDGETRKYMVEEIDMDVASDKIYRSSYLSQRAQGNWPDMIRHAAEQGNDDTLATELRRPGILNSTTTRHTAKGRVIIAKVPYNAAEVMAEGEFNRFFVRGLCRRAIANSIERLQVYRAKPVAIPRPESEARIGHLIDPKAVLIDLRVSQGVETALGIPPGPGSGITVRIPK